MLMIEMLNVRNSIFFAPRLSTTGSIGSKKNKRETEIEQDQESRIKYGLVKDANKPNGILFVWEPTIQRERAPYQMKIIGLKLFRISTCKNFFEIYQKCVFFILNFKKTKTMRRKPKFFCQWNGDRCVCTQNKVHIINQMMIFGWTCINIWLRVRLWAQWINDIIRFRKFLFLGVNRVFDSVAARLYMRMWND